MLPAQVEPPGLMDSKGVDEDGWIPSQTSLDHKLGAKAEVRLPESQLTLCVVVESGSTDACVSNVSQNIFAYPKPARPSSRVCNGFNISHMTLTPPADGFTVCRITRVCPCCGVRHQG